MGLPPEEIEKAALKLSPERRAQLAERLVQSLEADAEVAAAWASEIRARVDDLRTSRVKPIDGDTVFEKLKRYRR